jgi:hypothetical protein
VNANKVSEMLGGQLGRLLWTNMVSGFSSEWMLTVYHWKVFQKCIMRNRNFESLCVRAADDIPRGRVYPKLC